MCHIVGVGFADFRETAARVLSSDDFLAIWHEVEPVEEEAGRSRIFRHRMVEPFFLSVSQPNEECPGSIQLLATAVLEATPR